MTSISPPSPEGVAPSPAPVAGDDSVSRETLIALKNAALMAVSLIGTLGVAVAVRIWMPRFLGPHAFGALHFAEELAAACMFFTTLGFETHIKRAVATRPAHASEFFGGMIQLRLAATIVVFGAMATLLWLMGKSVVEWQLVFLFGLGQVFLVLNNSFASLLQATGSVGGLALVNIASKVVWGAAVIVSLWLGGGLQVVALSFALTEALRAPVLLRLCRKELGLRLRFELAPVLAVLAFCLPYYLNQLTHEVYARTGVTMLSGMANDAEVGWFGAANHIKTLVLLVLPIINAVVLPMASRLAQQSSALLGEMMRGAVKVVLGTVTPLAFVLALDAPDIIHLLFSSEYAPAARHLQVLAVLIPLSSYCVLSSMHLLLTDRMWAVTSISVLGLVVNLLAMPLFIAKGGELLGTGGAGVGAAVAAVLTEATVAGALYITLADRASSRVLAALAARLAGVAAVLGLAHVLLDGLGMLRLPIDALLCLVVGSALGLIPLRAILTQVRAVLVRRPSPGGAFRS